MPNNDFAEQQKTLLDTKEKLAINGKCAILRPTGFGKTYLMTELIKDYDKVLYLYPSAVIKDTVVERYYENMYDAQTLDYVDENGNVLDPETIEAYLELKTIKNCDLMTYAKLIRLSDEELENMEYDLIMFDEMHRLGGARTKIATEKLFALNPDAHFVGATATPTRMDNFDTVGVFFNNIMCYAYTLHQAIESGMIKKPNYYFCTTDVRQDLLNEAKAAGEDTTDEIVSKIIDAKVIESANLFDMDVIIKDACDKYSVDKDYFKFIVFFSTKDHMAEKLPDVVEWFKKAYPDFTIDTLPISSASSSESRNTEKLNSLIPRKKHIDIIACIDMLNVGYHVNNLTGILMYRVTASSTIFIQQLGRALSAGSNNSAIVIDVVDNLHRPAVFELQSSLCSGSKSRKPKATAKKTVSPYFVSPQDNATIVTVDNKGNIVNTQYHLDKDNNIVDHHDNPSIFEYNCDDGKIYENVDMTNKNVNEYLRDDFHMSGHEATYREFLAKALAEPLTQRCKYALEIHFRSWCMNHNVPYPISDKELKELYSLDKNDFYKEFCNVIQKNQISYPLQDANMLMQIGKDQGTIDVPLDICAKARNVSIEQVLNLLEIA